MSSLAAAIPDRPRRFYAAFFFTAICCGRICNCFAEDDIEAAKIHFDSGVRYIEQGNYARALDAFEASFRERENPRVLYNIAMAQKALQRFTAALASFERYLALQPGEAASSLTQEVAREIADLKRRVASINISLSTKKGSVAVVDDALQIAMPQAVSVYLMPGVHKIRVESREFGMLQTDFTAKAGEKIPINLYSFSPASRIRVECPQVKDAEVSLDGNNLGACPVVTVTTPGTHVIAVSAEGRKPFEREIWLDKWQRAAFVAALSTDSTEAASNSNPSVKTAKNPSCRVFATTGGISLSAGVAALAVGIAYNVKGVHDSERADRLGASWDGTIDDSVYSEYNELKNHTLPADTALTAAGYVASAVFTGVGIGLLVYRTTHCRAKPKSSVARRLAPTAGGFTLFF